MVQGTGFKVCARSSRIDHLIRVLRYFWNELFLLPNSGQYHRCFLLYRVHFNGSNICHHLWRHRPLCRDSDDGLGAYRWSRAQAWRTYAPVPPSHHLGWDWIWVLQWTHSVEAEVAAFHCDSWHYDDLDGSGFYRFKCSERHFPNSRTARRLV